MSTIDVVIQVSPTYCTILPQATDFNPINIENLCSFEPTNALYTSAYKAGEWDGKYRLFNLETMRFPTGLLPAVLDDLDLDGYSYQLEYLYIEPTLHKLTFRLSPHIQFRPYQQHVIDVAVLKKRGVIQLPTGAGKTLVASGIIQQFGLYTLFLVHTKDLLYQAYNVFTMAFPHTKIGIIGDGQCILGEIIVATIQTISPKIYYEDELYGNYNYDIEQEYDEEDIVLIKSEKKTDVTTDFVHQILEQSELIIFDECLISDTLIELENGLYKKIQDIQNGDKIVGGIVSNKFVKEVEKTIKIKTSFGELETTETHPNFIIEKLPLKNKQYLNPNESDVMIKKSNELSIGNYLLIPNYKNHQIYTSNYSNDLLYFIGFFLGDGHIDKSTGSNRLKFEFHNKEKVNLIEPIFQKVLKNIDINSNVQSRESNRKNIKNHNNYWIKTIWANSKKLKTLLINDFSIPIGKKSNDIVINNNILNNSLDSLKSFLQGCFDSEGWVLTHNKRIGIAYSSLLFVKKLQLILLKFNIKSKLYERKRKNLRHKSLYMLDITGKELEIFRNRIGFNLPSKYEKLNQILKNKPQKTNNHYVNYNGNIYWLSKIKEIETIHKKTIVYDFTTTTHSFIANGFLTHNCQHLSSYTFYKIAMKSKSPFRFGLSATPFRDDGFEMKIEAGLGNIIYKITTSQLIQEGYLIAPLIKFFKVPPKSFPRQVTFNKVYKEYVVDHPERNQIIKLKAEDEAKKHRQVLILVKHIRHVENLKALLPNAESMDGRMSAKVRTEILSRFKTKQFQILIATTLADEGLDVPNLDVLILAGGGKSKTKTLQRIGRVIRLGDICPQCQSVHIRIVNRYEPCLCLDCGHQFEYHGKDQAIIYDFCDNAKWLYDHYLIRKGIYETEEEFKFSYINVKIQ